MSLIEFVSPNLHVTSFHVTNGDCTQNSLVLSDMSGGETNTKMTPEAAEHHVPELDSAKPGTVYD